MEAKIILNIILFLIVLVVLIFVWFPAYKKLQDLQIDLAQKKLDLKNKELYFAKLKEISNKLNDYQTEIEKINSAIPDKEEYDLINVISFLAKKSGDNGLILTGVSLDKSSVYKKNNKITKNFLNISFAGSYQNFKEFLSKIEKNARLIDFQSISLSTFGEKSELEFKLKVSVSSY